MTTTDLIDFDAIPDLARYNGNITLISTATGAHHRLRVYTKHWAAKGRYPARQVRIVEAITTDGAKPFGEVAADGAVKVWRTGAGVIPDGVLWSLNSPLAAWERGIRFELGVLCRKCDMALTNPASLALGIGPTCGDEVHRELRALKLSKLTDDERFGEVRAQREAGRLDLAGAAARAITNPDARAAAVRLLMR